MNILLRIQVFGSLWCCVIGSDSSRIIILGLLDPCRWRHCVPLKHRNQVLNNTVLHCKRPEFSTTPVWKPQISETYCSLHIEVMLVKLKTLRLDYFLSDHRHCEDYYRTTYNLLCPISKKSLGSDLANRGAIIPCLLFCHQNQSLNNAENCVSFCPVFQKKRFSLVIGLLSIKCVGNSQRTDSP